MIAPFEKQQLESGIVLSTDERLVAETEWLTSIAENASKSIVASIHKRPESLEVTDDTLFSKGKEEIYKGCKNMIFDSLNTLNQYDGTKSYDEFVQSKVNNLVCDIIISLNKHSLYVASRCNICEKDISETITTAVKQWFITPQEQQYLKEKGYWDYYGIKLD